jgi:hypothetical protein
MIRACFQNRQIEFPECARPRAQQQSNCGSAINHRKPSVASMLLWPGTATLRILKTRLSVSRPRLPDACNPFLIRTSVKGKFGSKSVFNFMNKLPAILLLAFTLGLFMSASTAMAGTVKHAKAHKHAKHHHVRHHKTGK